MTDVIKVAITGIVAAICAVVIRKQVPELAMLLSICAGIAVLIYCSGALASAIEFFDKLQVRGNLTSGVVTPVIKVTGIAVITRLSADFCKDAKEGALATAVETAGAVLALFCIMPLMSSVLDLLGEML